MEKSINIFHKTSVLRLFFFFIWAKYGNCIKLKWHGEGLVEADMWKQCKNQVWSKIGPAIVIQWAEIWLYHGPYVARVLATRYGPLVDRNSLMYLGRV